MRCTTIAFALTICATLLLTACDDPNAVAPTSAPGDAERGRIAITQYACRACHIIPGITGSRVFVGPSLDGIATRAFIAGDVPNTPDNLMTWIRHPKSIDPNTAMPDMGVQEQHARDMVAYLATLK
jgi:cytochrome c2